MSNQKNTGQFDLSLLFCARLEPEKIGQGLKRLKPKLQIFIEFLLSKRKENQGSTLMEGRKKQKVYKRSQEGIFGAHLVLHSVTRPCVFHAEALHTASVNQTRPPTFVSILVP